MPDAYKSPLSKLSGEGETTYLTVRGKSTVFPGNIGVTFGDITDGPSNTIMTVEVSDDRAVVWTKPDDFQYDEQNPQQGLRRWSGLLHYITDKEKGLTRTEGGFLVGMADGAVRDLPASIKPKTLNALFTRNGGEHVDIDQVLGN
jgi:hypothetical protein